MSIIMICGTLFLNTVDLTMRPVCIPYDRSIFTYAPLGQFGSFRFGARGGSIA